MSWLDGLRHRLRPLVAPAEFQRDVDEEVRFHLAMEAAHRTATTGDPDAAARFARQEFGPPTYYREETRRVTILGWLDVLRQDIRYGWRALMRSPAFTITAIASLALGIGANTAIFGLVYSVLLEPLPVPHPEQLVAVDRVRSGPAARRGGGLGGFSLTEVAQMQQAPGLKLSSYTSDNVTVEVPGQKLSSTIDLVAGDFFSLMAVPPAAGRLIGPDDEREARPVAVISEVIWETRWNRSRDAIGATIKLNDQSFTVIGVVSRAWHGPFFPGSFAMAVPMSTASVLQLVDPRSPSGGDVLVMGRLAEGASVAGAGPTLAALYQRCCGDGQLAHVGKAGAPAGQSSAMLTDISHGVPAGKFDLRGQYGDLLLVMMAGVIVVLLIACANVGNLLLARATVRTRELAVRLSMGASRGRIVRQLLTESLLLAVIGGALGFGLAALGTKALLHNLPGNLVIATDFVTFRLKPAILTFTVSVAMGSVLIFGLVPALRASRTDLTTPLKEGGDSRGGTRSGFLGRGIVVAQVSLALLLVSCAGLLGATLRNLRNIDGGFATDHVFLATIDSRQTPFERNHGMIPIYPEILSRLRAIPGVTQLSMSSTTPVYGGRTMMNDFTAEGYTTPAGASDFSAFVLATPGFFSTAGITIKSGRDFNDGDRAGGSRVALISQAFADQYFAGRDAIGHTIDFKRGSADTPATVIGIVGDAKYNDLRGAPIPTAYYALSQWEAWPFVSVTARTTLEAGAFAAQLRRVVAEYSPDLHVTRQMAMEEAMDIQLSRERLAAGLAMVFAAMALGLAAVGLYGVVSYGVSRRTAEIGVRMALGAQTRDVVWHILRGSLLMVVVGVAIGIPLTYVGGKAVASFLFGIGAHDPLLVAGAAAVLAFAAIAASLIPAARAARIDPLVALRSN